MRQSNMQNFFFFWNQTILYTVESKETVQSTCWFNDVYQNWIVKAGLLYRSILVVQLQPFSFSMAMGCEFRQMLAANFDGWLPISQSASFFPFYTDRFSSYGTTGASRIFFLSLILASNITYIAVLLSFTYLYLCIY